MFLDNKEINTAENNCDIDSDFESEMNDKYDQMLSGKSKEELLNLRSYLIGDDNADKSDDEDKPLQKVKKRYN